jgi:hypothetical protein
MLYSMGEAAVKASTQHASIAATVLTLLLHQELK